MRLTPDPLRSMTIKAKGTLRFVSGLRATIEWTVEGTSVPQGKYFFILCVILLDRVGFCRQGGGGL